MEKLAKSNAFGKMHEVLVQHYLLGKTKEDTLHPIENVVDFFDYNSQMSTEMYQQSWQLAEQAAEYVKDNILDFPVETVERNIKKTKAQEQVNAADLLVNNKLGLSLKVSLKPSKPYISNIGASVLNKVTGINPIGIYDQGKLDFYNQHPYLVKLSLKKQRKEFRNDEMLLKHQRDFGRAILVAMSVDYFSSFEVVSKDDLAKFVRKHVLRAWETDYTVYQVTTNPKKITHKIPFIDYDHILSDPKNISVKLKGNTILFNHYEDPFAFIRLKFGNMFGSSIKAIGGTVGE